MVWKIDPVQAANTLTKGMKNKAMRIALNAGASPVKAAVVEQAPRGETGLLKKAFRIAVKHYKALSKWVAVIGVKSDFERKGKRPGRYHSIVDRFKKFMSSAFNSSKGNFDNRVRQKLDEQIKILAAQTPKKK